MKNYNFGDVVLLSFPFTDSSASKKRPAMIVLDTEDEDVIVTRITSKINESQFDCEISNWKSAGLLFPSTIRLHKIASLEKKIIERKLGTIQRNDLKKVAAAIKDLFNSL
jgi:mRNA interferase MazF